MFWCELKRNDSLTTLNSCSGTYVLSESTAHSLGNTVSTCTSSLLVFTKEVVRVCVNSQCVILSTSNFSNSGIRNNTSCFQSSVSNLTRFICDKVQFHQELSCLCSTAVSNVELHNSVVWNTTDILASSICRTFQSTVHLCGLTCHA